MLPPSSTLVIILFVAGGRGTASRPPPPARGPPAAWSHWPPLLTTNTVYKPSVGSPSSVSGRPVIDQVPSTTASVGRMKRRERISDSAPASGGRFSND